MTETINAGENLQLQAVAEHHIAPLHQLVRKNSAWLQQSLNWPASVREEEDTRKSVQGNILLHQRGYAKMYMIMAGDELVGVLSFNQIEPLNKAAYIGYWLDESHQGKGTMSRALQALMRHYAERGEVRRFVIKCRVANHASNQVARRNGFELEGCLKQAEYLNGRYDDVNLYARIISASSD
ncbi:50S ribosomal protein L7/L12-serine acetyltransferase [Citrobacter sedlakii]|uniref:50S ribosomal protein L7/L12-serine acetyltransferase n=1 Tax=Citrobacter sedlakii TaxID=67826 RepID=A0ABS0ZLS1_9ENTR|nr:MULTISPECIES: 50S ribosomal protein L7/L12-serine acetyltransferase [Citrobacter]EHG7580099.1 50S ribosomal protein L7/L12-serine acetyltransferase [Citrobacter sedlakii]EIQ7156336.1 50S ribosomal protein L7/L12-serine acetyltransferase [Citrobacter sedlakii]MBJ8379760.1 50S ribosomal protein L7/L12-serine acetyltransferase [Citrobacter sedlakii]MBJ9890023.1 50S ribosomal protein L7/L12-serine acetyltransferase [Citrobacter sedlakii]MBN6598102.1 50S ribosomal protein L7/L12-serine acetyltra